MVDDTAGESGSTTRTSLWTLLFLLVFVVGLVTGWYGHWGSTFEPMPRNLVPPRAHQKACPTTGSILPSVETKPEAESEPLPGVELLVTGEFFGQFVTAKSGEGWLGLYENGGEYELRPTLVTISEWRDPDLGTMKKVEVDQPTEPKFLIKGAREIQEGKVKVFFRRGKFLWPGQIEYFRSDTGTYYTLGAEGSASIEGAMPNIVIREYRLVLSANPPRISQVLLDIPIGLDDANPGLIWAGDLDRDGKADLFMNVSRHYAGSDLVLFLSSAAKEGKLVGKVAEFGYSTD